MVLHNIKFVKTLILRHTKGLGMLLHDRLFQLIARSYQPILGLPILWQHEYFFEVDWT